jgi:hypothetical protein
MPVPIARYNSPLMCRVALALTVRLDRMALCEATPGSSSPAHIFLRLPVRLRPFAHALGPPPPAIPDFAQKLLRAAQVS